MSIRQKQSDTAAPKGSAWKKNVIFALVVLALAAGIFLAVRAQHPAKGSGLQAVVDFGDGVTETLPLAQDHDYLYEVGDYIVHLQVKDGAIAFLDSQCPDHVCEQFGWLDKDGAWAACVPAGGVCGGRAHRRRRVKGTDQPGLRVRLIFFLRGENDSEWPPRALWPYFKEFDFLSGILKSLRAFQNPFFTGRRPFDSYYKMMRSCSAAHEERSSLLKKSETLWKCRETKNGRLFIGAKCDTLQI